MPRETVGVLFVCLGNICRSPLAEAVFRAEVERAGLSDRFEIDSAGTSDYHIGEPPDSRTVSTAASRGVKVEHSARQVMVSDLVEFDYVLAMDADNLRRLERLSSRSSGTARMALLRAFEPEQDGVEVPDPYYGGERGFEDVHDLVERACRGLLEHIIEERGLE